MQIFRLNVAGPVVLYALRKLREADIAIGGPDASGKFRDEELDAGKDKVVGTQVLRPDVTADDEGIVLGPHTQFKRIPDGPGARLGCCRHWQDVLNASGRAVLHALDLVEPPLLHDTGNKGIALGEMGARTVRLKSY